MPEYSIDGKTYAQKPLVLGQWRQLRDILKGLTIPGNVNAMDMIDVLGDNLPLALAVVLNPGGVPLKDKDLTALADELEFSIGADTVIQVIEDFFACNPLPLILTKLSEAAGILGGMMMPRMSSTPSSSPSPEETSLEGTTSFGDSPLPSANPG